MKKIVFTLLAALLLTGCSFLTLETTVLNTTPLTNSTSIATTTTITTSVSLTTTEAIITTTGEVVFLSFGANIEGASIQSNIDAPIHSGDFVTLTATPLEGYRFVHWVDLDNEKVVSRLTNLSVEINRNRQFMAVYTLNDTVGIFVLSNADDLIPVLPEMPFGSGEELSIIAPETAEIRFLYWYDMASETKISTNNPLIISPDIDMYLLAVYEEYLGERLTYETGFEDATKASYALGTIETNEFPFTLNEALIGSLANDKKEGSKSVRIGNGYLETGFETEALRKIEFVYAYYGTDGTSAFSVAVSSDKSTWIALDDSISTTDTLQTFSFQLTDDWYQLNDLLLETALYIRITGSADKRINIDEFKIWREAFDELPLVSIFADDTDSSFPDNSERADIVFAEGFKVVLAQNELWDQSLCNALDTELGETECQIYGAVDTTKLGYYDVIYYYLDPDGNYASAPVTHVVLHDPSLLEQDYVGYYDGIEGLYGDDLLLKLREIINDGLYRRSYDEARTILADADVAPLDDTKVLTIYTRELAQRVWDAESWHREHIWPNSRLGVPRVDGSDRNIASDLHNLRAIIPSINSSRSNKIFAFETTSETFDPGPDRGEVSRTMFYMVVMYDYLDLVDEILPNDPETNYTLAGANMSLISAFLTWHYEDPVDQFERDRNETIYIYQNNRNPFVDHPELVELIWFDEPAFPLG
ncbi:MAG: endonuclease [Candidatus Izemoplasmatales bacterium]